METIVGYHDLLIHNYGPSQTFASVHIEIDDRWDLKKPIRQSMRLKRSLRRVGC